ncbi:unnamed protein product [Vitrella brassicaformis CCMP3155]|uniref:J domain-containing protein n=1 Tax=Vitrella brassicaformis (strain CCMP3155) TaxID=1169540 RepID=A0A0G4GKH3_VITBC|nr:unnamed protein product [Vitrella brassicaformis CCMP3155]|eukprot:CEM30530.1 unnamed protein product [Vitrella brassicaformis CCMP3155]
MARPLLLALVCTAVLAGHAPADEIVSTILAATDFYDALRVGRDSTRGKIEKAYWKLVFKVHPSIEGNGGAPKAERALKKLREAFDTLTDDEKRRKYDARLTRRFGIVSFIAGAFHRLLQYLTFFLRAILMSLTCFLCALLALVAVYRSIECYQSWKAAQQKKKKRMKRQQQPEGEVIVIDDDGEEARCCRLADLRPRAPAGMWSCERCTFFNSRSVPRCELCGEGERPDNWNDD